MAGRPTAYTDKIADAICERVASGESMRTICSAAGMPNRSTVLRWLDQQSAFAAKHARAREAQADVMDERIMDEAVAATPETANVARVRIDAFKWRAARLAPKKYGDRTIVAGDAENPVRQIVDYSNAPAELLRAVASLPLKEITE